jgi:hypothetical protein
VQSSGTSTGHWMRHNKRQAEPKTAVHMLHSLSSTPSQPSAHVHKPTGGCCSTPPGNHTTTSCVRLLLWQMQAQQAPGQPVSQRRHGSLSLSSVLAEGRASHMPGMSWPVQGSASYFTSYFTFTYTQLQATQGKCQSTCLESGQLLTAPRPLLHGTSQHIRTHPQYMACMQAHYAHHHNHTLACKCETAGHLIDTETAPLSTCMRGHVPQGASLVGPQCAYRTSKPYHLEPCVGSCFIPKQPCQNHPGTIWHDKNPSRCSASRHIPSMREKRRGRQKSSTLSLAYPQPRSHTRACSKHIPPTTQQACYYEHNTPHTFNGGTSGQHPVWLVIRPGLLFDTGRNMCMPAADPHPHPDQHPALYTTARSSSCTLCWYQENSYKDAPVTRQTRKGCAHKGVSLAC